MAPKRRRATPRASEGSPSTGEPTTFEPFSRIPSAVQSTEASQGQLDSTPADPGTLFRAGLKAYARTALGQSIEAASQVATSCREFLRFGAWRFDNLICRFSASFDDSCLHIGEPFVRAASEAARKRSGCTP
jgi:hypothetical protein